MKKIKSVNGIELVATLLSDNEIIKDEENDIKYIAYIENNENKRIGITFVGDKEEFVALYMKDALYLNSVGLSNLEKYKFKLDIIDTTEGAKKNILINGKELTLKFTGHTYDFVAYIENVESEDIIIEDENGDVFIEIPRNDWIGLDTNELDHLIYLTNLNY